jgi:hypothetical protein
LHRSTICDVRRIDAIINRCDVYTRDNALSERDEGETIVKKHPPAY